MESFSSLVVEKLDVYVYRLIDPRDGETFYVDEMDVRLTVDPAGSGDITSRFAEVAKRGRAQKANNAVEVWGAHGTGKKFLLDMWV